MARVTVEDCLENVANRFELIMVASKRARQIANDGAEPLVPIENDRQKDHAVDSRRTRRVIQTVNTVGLKGR